MGCVRRGERTVRLLDLARERSAASNWSGHFATDVTKASACEPLAFLLQLSDVLAGATAHLHHILDLHIDAVEW